MLGLQLETDPRWVDIASKTIEEILIDHAWCEQKAASSGISLIVTFPEKVEMVSQVSRLNSRLELVFLLPTNGASVASVN